MRTVLRPRGGRQLTPGRVPRIRARPRAAAWLLAAALLGLTRASDAEDVAVPAALEVEILAKVAAYDRNLKARAGDKVRILLVVRAGDADSERVEAQVRSALEQIPAIAGMPHEEIVSAWSNASALVAAVRDRHAAIVVVCPGFATDVEAIRDALAGADVLSAATVADYVPRGVVVGFDLVSGKPKILVNLRQARAQNVALSAEILKIAKVYE